MLPLPVDGHRYLPLEPKVLHMFDSPFYLLLSCLHQQDDVSEVVVRHELGVLCGLELAVGEFED